jgi:hypothetical protein
MLRWIRSARQETQADATREDLRDALAVTVSFQNYVQHADAKVNVLVVVHAGAAAIVAAQSGGMGKLTEPGSFLGYGLLGLFGVGFLVSGYHILQVLRPVLRAPAVRSRYGITGVTERPPGTTGGERLSATEATANVPAKIAEAWAMSRLLAEIAKRKHRHVLRALPWTAVMLVSAICWTVLVAAWS